VEGVEDWLEDKSLDDALEVEAWVAEDDEELKVSMEEDTEEDDEDEVSVLAEGGGEWMGFSIRRLGAVLTTCFESRGGGGPSGPSTASSAWLLSARGGGGPLGPMVSESPLRSPLTELTSDRILAKGCRKSGSPLRGREREGDGVIVIDLSLWCLPPGLRVREDSLPTDSHDSSSSFAGLLALL